MPCAAAVQAWFPAHAEIWNAPTWFLSALTFAMIVLPHVLPAIASMRKKGLKVLLGVLTLTSLVAKLAYSYDLNCWTILEGMCGARSHPNLLFWNVIRFNPFYNLLEVSAAFMQPNPFLPKTSLESLAVVKGTCYPTASVV